MNALELLIRLHSSKTEYPVNVVKCQMHIRTGLRERGDKSIPSDSSMQKGINITFLNQGMNEM